MSNSVQVAALFFNRENMPSLRGLLLPCGSVWFVAMDALALIGCANSPTAMKRFAPEDWRQIGPDNPLGLHLHTRVISEKALVQLLQIGRKPEADEARRWVFLHVIPTAYTLRRGALEGMSK